MENTGSPAKWQIAEDALSSKIDDEVIIMGLRTDNYYGLDAVASRIWELLSSPMTLDELCRHLMEEYDVDEVTCQQQTLQFLRDMAQKKLIRKIA